MTARCPIHHSICGFCKIIFGVIIAVTVLGYGKCRTPTIVGRTSPCPDIIRGAGQITWMYDNIPADLGQIHCSTTCFMSHPLQRSNERAGLTIHRILEGTGDVLIPEEQILNKLSNNDHLKLYDMYNDQIEQIFCQEKVRFGGAEEGKILCSDKPFKPSKPCLVYSFGSNNQWDFEIGVKEHFQCEQHTFDPSMTHMKPSEIRYPDGVVFHHYGLSNFDGRTENDFHFDVKTLGTIRQELNHTERVIDILKMDIEFEEWNSLDDIIKSGLIRNVKQLLVEFHFWNRARAKCLSVLRDLYLAGFRKFSRERLAESLGAVYENTKSGKHIGTQYEMSFINIHF